MSPEAEMSGGNRVENVATSINSGVLGQKTD